MPKMTQAQLAPRDGKRGQGESPLDAVRCIKGTRTGRKLRAEVTRITQACLKLTPPQASFTVMPVVSVCPP